MNKRTKAVYDVLTRSNYRVHAIGSRHLENKELIDLCNILAGSPQEMLDKSNHLYKYAPATVQMDKDFQRLNCNHFDSYRCECFYPDTKNKCWYREMLERDNQRDRDSQEYKEWREKVFNRDNYTCQDCKKHGGTLNAHHIKPYAVYKDLRFEVSNGITLCEDCHKARHKRRV